MATVYYGEFYGYGGQGYSYGQAYPPGSSPIMIPYPEHVPQEVIQEEQLQKQVLQALRQFREQINNMFNATIIAISTAPTKQDALRDVESFKEKALQVLNSYVDLFNQYNPLLIQRLKTWIDRLAKALQELAESKNINTFYSEVSKINLEFETFMQSFTMPNYETLSEYFITSQSSQPTTSKSSKESETGKERGGETSSKTKKKYYPIYVNNFSYIIPTNIGDIEFRGKIFTTDFAGSKIIEASLDVYLNGQPVAVFERRYAQPITRQKLIEQLYEKAREVLINWAKDHYESIIWKIAKRLGILVAPYSPNWHIKVERVGRNLILSKVSMTYHDLIIIPQLRFMENMPMIKVGGGWYAIAIPIAQVKNGVVTNFYVLVLYFSGTLLNCNNIQCIESRLIYGTTIYAYLCGKFNGQTICKPINPIKMFGREKVARAIWEFKQWHRPFYQ